MRVFVTGGTGFTGSQVVPRLLKNGYQVRCLHRNKMRSGRSLAPDLPGNHQDEIEWLEGDLADTQKLAFLMRGSDALINVASLGFGHADSILDATREAGIRRAIFISTTAIYTQLNARSKSIRLAAEHSIQTSGLAYTILRPTMIYGSPRDRNMWRLIRFLSVCPIVPVFGDGTHLQQPIYVDDVAGAVVNCLCKDQTIGKSYNIAGKNPLTYNDVIDTIAHLLRKRVWKIFIPSAPVVFLLKLFERIPIPLPVKSEQVLRLNEDKDFSYQDAQTDFGFAPLSFEQGITLELERYGDKA